MRVWRRGSRLRDGMAVTEIAVLWGGAWLAVSLVADGVWLRPVDVWTTLLVAAVGAGLCLWLWAERRREAASAIRRRVNRPAAVITSDRPSPPEDVEDISTQPDSARETNRATS